MRAGNLLFLAGQVSLDANGDLVGEGDVRAQTRQTILNIQALCEAAGATLDDIVKLTVYLVNVDDLPAVREIRGEFFKGPEFPASTLIGSIVLARPEFLIEIEAVVALA
jgi:enamine deaminase RidA (YjgF/YER057c/UK114 family)